MLRSHWGASDKNAGNVQIQSCFFIVQLRGMVLVIFAFMGSACVCVPVWFCKETEYNGYLAKYNNRHLKI